MNKEQHNDWIKIIIFGMLVVVILLIGINTADAVEVYSGESYTFPTEEFEYYTVVGNSSSLEGMIVEWLNGNTTISFDMAYQSDNFTIILFNEKEVIKEVNVGGGSSGGGGGSRTIYRDRNITEYEILEHETIGDTIIKTETEIEEVETIIEKIPQWMLWVVVGLSIILAIMTIKVILNKNEEFEEDDKKTTTPN